jgi:hypothetical protein
LAPPSLVPFMPAGFSVEEELLDFASSRFRFEVP